MKAVNINEAKTQLSALIAQVENGNESIIICRYGTPVAELSKPKRQLPRSRTDPELSQIRDHGDLLESTTEEWEAAD